MLCGNLASLAPPLSTRGQMGGSPSVSHTGSGLGDSPTTVSGDPCPQIPRFVSTYSPFQIRTYKCDYVEKLKHLNKSDAFAQP